MDALAFRVLPAASKLPQVIAERHAFGQLRRAHWVDHLGTEQADENGCERDWIDPYADAFGVFVNGRLGVGARLIESRNIGAPLPIQEHLRCALPDDAVEISRLVANPAARSNMTTMASFLVWVATTAAELSSFVCMNINEDALKAIESRGQRFGYKGLFEPLDGRQMVITARNGRPITHIPMRLRTEALDPTWVEGVLRDLVPAGAC